MALRSCLDDPVKATSTETLAAVLVLIICQSYVGPGDLPWSGHVEGSAKILKARGLIGAREGDEFENKILLSLRGCVVRSLALPSPLVYICKHGHAYDCG